MHDRCMRVCGLDTQVVLQNFRQILKALKLRCLSKHTGICYLIIYVLINRNRIFVITRVNKGTIVYCCKENSLLLIKIIKTCFYLTL